jgi:hypothetical protein
MESLQLQGICNEWLAKGRGTGVPIAEFAKRWETFGLLLCTNRIVASGASYEYLFAVRPQAISDHGMLAVAANKAVLWIGDDGTTKVIRPE